ncbi:chloride channel protein [Alloacidobacterium dinghuense]|uniref:Chloride channel protein n=1 Tax=Alloacidobacterium dinghuense TaxID=2763107 RepID=A0A7G8BMH8_9BACT|nr:chloride channel protein [Alloacidobacterium dinghuense]QNI33748.1 chloride channel protein [Alloacidobacterium dinghuense]
MTTATLTKAEATENAVTTWLTSAAWAALLGVASGSACVAVRLFFRLLQWIFVQQTGMLPVAATSFQPARRVLTPIIGAALATFVVWLMRRLRSGLDFEEYVEAVRLKNGRIPFLSTLWRTVASAFPIATGAAIGREGVMIQFAAATTSWVGGRFPTRNFSLSRQVAYGAAAAVAAAYQAPIAGAFFGAEIVLGECAWIDILPLLLASASGWIVSRAVLGAGPLFPIAGRLPMTPELLWVFPLAVILGASGPAYQKLLHLSRAASRLPLALLWSGLAVGLLSLIEPRVWGNGDAALVGILRNKTTLLSIISALGCRIAATTFCVGTGTIGGVFTPTLFAGAALGLVAGHCLHLSYALVLGLCGMGALMAAVTHAPLMAALMAVELTGQWHLLPVIIPCCLLASFVARTISRDSLYGIASPEPAQ